MPCRVSRFTQVHHTGSPHTGEILSISSFEIPCLPLLAFKKKQTTTPSHNPQSHETHSSPNNKLNQLFFLDRQKNKSDPPFSLSSSTNLFSFFSFSFLFFFFFSLSTYFTHPHNPSPNPPILSQTLSLFRRAKKKEKKTHQVSLTHPL
jgi:hypothetical protein